jgi:deazaflavin-dependent oxidoreductase (nitroreductase family)
MALTDHKPRGLLRLLLRAPIWLYRARLGWLAGHRLTYIGHCGRRTGARREVVVETVRYNPTVPEAVVVAAWGKNPDWYRNLQSAPTIEIRLCAHRWPVPDYRFPAAARRRCELTRAKAIRALRELEHTGAPVSSAAVAQAAGISRSWLYAEDDLRAEITRLREAGCGRAKTPTIPASQRASDASLRRRLELAEQRIRQLSNDNGQLRRELSLALGDQRQRHTVCRRADQSAGQT